MNRIDETTDNLLTIVKRAFQRIRFPSLAKEPSFQNWTVLLMTSFILAFLLTPQIHFNPPIYRVGMIASKDVRADRDFLVEERISTDLKRAEVAKDVSSVFDHNVDLAYQQRVGVTKAFLSMEEAFRQSDKQTRGGDYSDPAIDHQLFATANKIFGENLGVALTDEEYQAMLRYHFSPDLAGKLIKLLFDLYHDELVTNTTLLKQDMERGILIRDMKTYGEERLYDLSTIWHIRDVGTLLQKKAAVVMPQERREVRRVLISLASRIVKPNLIYNEGATEKKKQAALEGVKAVFFQVQKNEMIIREGEKITQTDVDKLEALYKTDRDQQLSNLSIFLGVFCLVIFLTMILYTLARKWFKKPAKLQTDMFFLAAISVMQFVIIRMGIFISPAVNRAFPILPTEACFFAIPFAIGPMIVGYLIMRKLALVFAIFASLLTAFLFGGRIDMTIYAFSGSIMTAYYIAHCRKRSAFLRAGLFLAVINGALTAILSLLSGDFFTLNTLIRMALGGIGGLLSGILVAGISPFFESLFKYTTDIRLLELANLDQPIFQRMIIEAPGTYHHSVVVASMVETAAEAIGANSLLAKVSAYYHDVGKMKKPQYYIENQRNGENRHEKLTPKMSGLVIISHVKEGCELATQAGLGREIIDIIRESHGTSLVNYFYEKAKKDKDPSIRALPESDFRYPGPKPQTKEAGLVLLGDVLEASSRTLTNPTPARIQNMVQERIEKVFMDGQLDECELTLRDLNKIADGFVRILIGIFHHRIKYPEPVLKEFGPGRKGPNGNSDRKPAEKNKDRPPTPAGGPS